MDLMKFLAGLVIVVTIHGIVAPPAPVDPAVALQEALRKRLNVGPAKNVIFFIGDGMGITTQTAARIYKGQKAGEVGEYSHLSFHQLPYTGLIKTYSADRQVSESGAAAAAMTGGRKINSGTLGVTPEVTRGDCGAVAGKEIDTIVQWTLRQGKRAGLVTTTRLTHATPASMYAHSAERKWEADSNQPDDVRGVCDDTAMQLVRRNSDIHVLLGGGRRAFLPNTTVDPEYPAKKGLRWDGNDLIQEWQDGRAAAGVNHAYVWNKEQMDGAPADTDYLFGLFENSHMQYEAHRDPAAEPSLAELVTKAVSVLSRGDKGYFLMVEAGRIDHAHHANTPRLAFEDTLALDAAVTRALDVTDADDTLIVVTSDHAHPFTFGSWTALNNPVLGTIEEIGFNNEPSLDLMPYLSLAYGNGPGPLDRTDLTGVDTTGWDYKYPASVPLIESTHGGQDVAVYATGPMAHLFSGVQENTYLAHAMAYASCVGDNRALCSQPAPTERPCPTSGGTGNTPRWAIFGAAAITLWSMFFI